MKKIMTIMAMVAMMVSAMPVMAREADAPEAPAEEVIEIDYFEEVVAEIDWQMASLAEEEDCTSFGKEIDRKNETAKWHVVTEEESMTVEIHDGMIYLDGIEEKVHITMDATLEDYYEYM